jgi:hypothetical protein
MSYYVYLRFEFRVVLSVTISAEKRCSVRLYIQLFVDPPQKAIFVLFILSIVIIIVDEELTTCHIS